MKRLFLASTLLLACAGVALAQAPLDPRIMQAGEIEGLQRRLADAKCYAGSIDGQTNDALKKAIAACPDQRPVLRIETGMHVGVIRRVAADAQCRLIATGAWDKTVRLWSAPDGRLLRTLRPPIGEGHVGKIFAVAMSPDGKWVVAGGWDTYANVDGNHSIYLFDTTTGQTVRRMGSLKNVINHLAFSADGRRVAAALAGGNGVHVFDVASGKELFADTDFGDSDSYGLTFTPDGGLLAVGYDGYVRHYGADGRVLAKVETRGGKRPASVAIDSAGKRVAVGFNDTVAVNLFDLPGLQSRGAADTSDIKRGTLSTVAWSSDGRRLYAGGQDWGGKRLRVFTPDGKRTGTDLKVSDTTLVSLMPCNDAIAFGSTDPSFGLIATNGSVSTLAATRSPDMRDKVRDAFTVSDDGRRLRFGLSWSINKPVAFDLAAGTLRDSPASVDGLRSPGIAGLPVTDWENNLGPKFRGEPIKVERFENTRSLAVRPDQSGFVLGSDYYVRAFDSAGKRLWSKQGPAAAWGVNLTKGGDVIAVAYDDGTIRWHRWKDGQELLAFFVNKDTRQWVAWTPTGYYKASAGGEDMIGWHINRGWEQPADFFPASKFRDTFARADIVDRVLDTLDEAEAVRAANAARPARAAAKAVTDMLPPVVTILSPADGSSSGEDVAVDYLVRSPSGLAVDSVDVLINGRPMAAARGLARPDDTSGLRQCLAQTNGLGRSQGGLQGCRGSMTVPLPPGSSELSLFARSGDRSGDVVKIRVSRTAAARGDELLKPKLYALAIGVSAYADPTLTLQYAAKDARDFAAALQNQKGGLYGDVIVRAMTDGDATREGILDGLDWLTKEVTSRDVGVVFLAGHGVLDDTGRFYFLGTDSDTKRLRTKAVPREDIQAALDTIAGKAMLFLDACHSGAVAGGRRGEVDINSIVSEFARSERGVVTFTASTGKQFSQENAAWGNGAFTKAVIEALGTPGQKGKADLLGKGTISASALDVYVTTRVKELTDGRQSPVMIRPSTVPDFTLAVVR